MCVCACVCVRVHVYMCSSGYVGLSLMPTEALGFEKQRGVGLKYDLRISVLCSSPST